MEPRVKRENKDKGKGKDIKSLEAELKILREEIAVKDDHYDKLLRLQAEFDNFRKRAAQDRAAFIKFANEGLILELVAILDDFERSIKSVEQKKDFDLLHQGVDMISKQLHRLLEEKGLKRIKSMGEKFNPHEHEAIEVVEGGKNEEDTISEELQPGYTLNGRIIRPAKVKVVKKKTESNDQKAEDISENKGEV